MRVYVDCDELFPDYIIRPESDLSDAERARRRAVYDVPDDLLLRYKHAYAVFLEVREELRRYVDA